LEDSNGNIIQELSTDADGAYAFTNLPAGEYCVHYENSSIYSPDSSIAGAVDPTTGDGPDSIQIGIQHQCGIQLDPGEDSITNDF